MTGKAGIPAALAATAAFALAPPTARGQGEWEITPASEKAARLGLEWLAANQGREGNWQSNDLGLVATGALAFLSAGHLPGRGKYGQNVQRALDYVVAGAKESGLINVGNNRRDMYNHGLATFVLTQAYGVSRDERVGKLLDKALRLIANVQCADGGWDYEASRQRHGHDLSLAVMQAKALRGAMDVGFEIDPRTVAMAIRSVREHYKPFHDRRKRRGDGAPAAPADVPGQFTYDGSRATTAMAAAGVVCLQEFGKYDDFRIRRSMDVVIEAIERKMPTRAGTIPFDAYTTYYVAQALYQVGGASWRRAYPRLRDGVVKTQRLEGDRQQKGSWEAGAHVSGVPGRMWGTATAVFVLSIPNRYLPILQQGYVEPKGGRPGATTGMNREQPITITSTITITTGQSATGLRTRTRDRDRDRSFLSPSAVSGGESP